MNTSQLVYEFTEILKDLKILTSNQDEKFIEQTINNEFRKFCSERGISCKQRIVLVKRSNGFLTYYSLATHDKKPIAFFKNNLILP